MLVIKVEVWPQGDMKAAEEVGRAFIWNEGPVGEATANYGIQLADDPPFEGPMLDPKNRMQPVMQALLRNIPRGTKHWALVRDALLTCLAFGDQ